MENADEFVQSQQLNVTRATEGLRLANVGYQQGIKTQVEVINAQSAVTTARVNYLQAIHQHVVAKLAVQRAMGTIVKTRPPRPPYRRRRKTKKGPEARRNTLGPLHPRGPEAAKKEGSD